MKGFRCSNCKRIMNDSCMLKDEIWKSVAKPREKELCLACVEKRLGRSTVKEDFKDVPINYIYFHLPPEEATPEIKRACFSWWSWSADTPEKLLELIAKLEQVTPMTRITKEFHEWLVSQAESLKKTHKPRRKGQAMGKET